MPKAKPPPVGCKACAFADKSTGSKRDGPWACTYQVELPPLPYSLAVRGLAERFNHQRDYVWRGDGDDCPTFKPLETPA